MEKINYKVLREFINYDDEILADMEEAGLTQEDMDRNSKEFLQYIESNYEDLQDRVPQLWENSQLDELPEIKAGWIVAVNEDNQYDPDSLFESTLKKLESAIKESKVINADKNQKIVQICGYCDADRSESDAWAKRGYEVSTGACKKCHALKLAKFTKNFKP